VTMKAGMLYGARDTRFEERAGPQIPSPTEAIVGMPLPGFQDIATFGIW
jgi:hypothetical protein